MWLTEDSALPGPGSATNVCRSGRRLLYRPAGADNTGDGVRGRKSGAGHLARRADGRRRLPLSRVAAPRHSCRRPSRHRDGDLPLGNIQRAVARQSVSPDATDRRLTAGGSGCDRGTGRARLRGVARHGGCQHRRHRKRHRRRRGGGGLRGLDQPGAGATPRGDPLATPRTSGPRRRCSPAPGTGRSRDTAADGRVSAARIGRTPGPGVPAGSRLGHSRRRAAARRLRSRARGRAAATCRDA